jgi:transposase-like protein
MTKITSLVEARKQFSTQEACEKYLAEMRWPNGVVCPRCGISGSVSVGISSP